MTRNEFVEELTLLVERSSSTGFEECDYDLAITTEYLASCLDTWDRAMCARQRWGESAPARKPSRETEMSDYGLREHRFDDAWVGDVKG